MKSKIKNVIFDYDGVIVDTMKSHIKIWNTISKSLGNGENITKEIVKERFLEGWQDFYQTTLGIPLIKINEANEMYKKLSKKSKKPKLFPGIKKVIVSLFKKVPLYVVTGSLTKRVKDDLREKGILKYFQDVWGHDEMPNLKKSQPEFILMPLKHWGIKPSEACSIGDTKAEIITGKLAGLYTIACTWGWNNYKLLKEAKPDFIVNKPSRIFKIINEFCNINK